MDRKQLRYKIGTHRNMRHFLSLTTLFLFLFCKLSSQEALYPVTNYTTKDYGNDFHATNMAIAQDQRGIIYAANGFKLLEFDGSRWNSYPINKETWILSMAIDSSGIIYVGSQNEFGMFLPDRMGNLIYQSLSDSLDLQDLDFTNVWKVHAFSGGVVFQAEEKIFLYRNGTIEVIKPGTSFHTSFIVNDKLYVRERESGLLEWKDNNLVRIKGGELFDTTGIFMMLPFRKKKDEILIGTQEKGFWLYEPENGTSPIRKFYVEDPLLLSNAKITGGTVTGEGYFAISTMLGGVIIIDTTGKTKAIIDTRYGLKDNDVKGIIPDQSRNLWLALNNGISRVEISSPLSVYTEKSGITGSINAVRRYQNLLFVGTNTGLFVQTRGNENEFPFKQAFNFTSPVGSLIDAGGSLFVGTDAGLFRITGNNLVKTGSEKSVTLFCDEEKRLLFSGGPKGLSAYGFDGTISRINSLRIENEDIIGISKEYDKTGPDDEYWIGTRYNGAVRIKVRNDFSFISERFDNTDGLPDGPVIPFSINSKTVFATIQGIYSFINENIVIESVPDSLKNNKDFSKGYFSESSDSSYNAGESVSFIVENKKKVWICSDNSVGFIDKRADKKRVSNPFRGIEAGNIFTIYPEENGICWIGTSDGLIRFDENRGKDYNSNYLSLIRKVSLLNNDSLIFRGTNFKTESGTLKIVADQPQDSKPSLVYRNNSLRFEFSASFFEYTDKIFYSYKLEGNNTRWSQWTQENFREYTNLFEGKYTFVVKARNIYGKESSEAYFSFIVLPPWYRSVIAYVIYAILAFILIWLFARIYSYRLKRENIRLEGIVTERTAEVVKQKDEIVSKNIVLEYQKKEIEDSIRYARRIQSAVIPSEKDCVNLLTDSFVFFRPLNIVSGDFYWISKAGNKIVFTAADCTGHGVPGAFMSMLGVAFLNEIVNKDNITSPDLILNNLREKVIQALQQQGISGETRDGMDIAIVSIDNQENKLEFAGAYNPLIMIRNGELIETPGDKMPIGIYENMHDFSKHEIATQQGDVFYMYSDGYEDQFGGPEGKKFKSKKLKQLLVEIHKQPMELQKEILEKTFEDWRGNLPQVDDIVVAGFAIR